MIGMSVSDYDLWGRLALTRYFVGALGADPSCGDAWRWPDVWWGHEALTRKEEGMREGWIHNLTQANQHLVNTYILFYT